VDAHRLSVRRAAVGPGVAPGAQRIPRPHDFAPGRRALWEALAPADRRGLGLAEVRAALALPPGEPEPVLIEELPRQDGRPAAVACLLFEDEGETEVVLTRRSNRLRAHTGEVAFPGGRIDPGEEAEHAALRETAEEIGLDPHAVEVIGRLPALVTYSRRSTVFPYVGLLQGRPQVRPNPAEVERVFSVRLCDLAGEQAFHEERWPVRAGVGANPAWHSVCFFHIDGDLLWGVTGRLIRELLNRCYSPRLHRSAPE
jgi:8-oxo-dGTP pyrophosphatase MutT (NUDIX family)